MHRTRQAMPKTWILKKKGVKYISASGNSKTIPLVIVMRDIIKNSENRKEVKKMIKETEIKINNKRVHDNKSPIRMGDIIEIDKKIYTLYLGENKKMQIREIKENNNKIVLKVMNKKVMNKDKTQINCSNGRNYLINNKESKNINTGDSVVVNLKDKKIIELLELKEGERVLVLEGKHIGKRGIIENINKENKIAEIKTKGEKINILTNYLIVEK